MKVIITGSSGILGSYFYSKLASSAKSCIRFDRNNFNGNTLIDSSIFYDMDTIIYCAANTNVEECEKNPLAAYRDNILLTSLILKSARLNKIKNFIYISSTGVYGSNKTDEPNNELHSTNPTTIHHASKLYSENMVLNFYPEALILRAGWLFGGSLNSKKNFVANRIREAMKSDVIYSNKDQIGSPTYALDFVDIALELINNNYFGIFNITNHGFVSRYEFVSKIFELCGINKKVVPVNEEYFSRIANVAKNESASSLALEAFGYSKLPNWDNALERYIKNEYLNDKLNLLSKHFE